MRVDYPSAGGVDVGEQRIPESLVVSWLHRLNFAPRAFLLATVE